MERNWQAIKLQYVTGDISLEKLADKIGIPRHAVRHHATKEQWTKDRTKYRADVMQKAAKKAANKASGVLVKEMKLVETLLTKTEEILEKSKLFNETSEEGGLLIAPADLLATARALRTVIDLKRDLSGGLLEYEKRTLDIQERKLALEERRIGTADAEQDAVGVVLLPPMREEGPGDGSGCDQDDADGLEPTAQAEGVSGAPRI